MRIGELATRANIGVETVRFYERQGILKVPGRAAGEYRQYDEESVRILQFVRRAKELGFTLKQIKGLLHLRSDTTSTKADVREEATKKIEEINTKIADLQRMRDGLQTLVGQCHGSGSKADCPILSALQRTDET